MLAQLSTDFPLLVKTLYNIMQFIYRLWKREGREKEGKSRTREKEVQAKIYNERKFKYDWMKTGRYKPSLLTVMGLLHVTN